ncbi:phosphopantetheine-binding protein [Curvivirga sp.]|uniref:phosphopantetheine-binding protein n=1 Tax=Curvivirga sp. TaxID=2856848 RepID=UPI003B59FA1A
MLNSNDNPKITLSAPLNSKEELFDHLLPLLDEEPEFDENLMDYGLTSIDVMKLVTGLREGGVEVKFEDLAKSLSIDGIWQCIFQARGV